MKLINVALLFCLISFHVRGQQRTFNQTNSIYVPYIKTVECYPLGKEQGIPIITLGSSEKLLFAFDDLISSNREYSYTIVHCTSDWKKSDIPSLEYIDGFSTDRIFDYRLSFNTVQKYTHYELVFPNDQMRPKLAGNYLLKVFDGDENHPIISQRFYVINNRVTLAAEVVPSPQVADRFKNQKVNFTVLHPFPISNPYQDVKAVVMQNFNPLTSVVNTKPAFIRPGALLYNDLTTNDFPGGYEFRKFDLRSLRAKGENIQNIYRDTSNTAILFTDQVNSTVKYASQFDENGRFYIRAQDGRDGRTDADYVHVNFSLAANNPVEGGVYVAGRFNNYQLSAENKLTYLPQRRNYVGNIILKQGLYDYLYVNPTDEKFSYFDGNFYETENTYQIFLYYNRPGGRFEELIGFTEVNTRNRLN